jgi:phenylacetate-CoA ligase
MSFALNGADRRLGEDSFHAFCRGWRIRAKDRLVHPLTFRYWPMCVAIDRMTRADLLALQDRRLGDLLSHAIRHVPFYRRWAEAHGYRPDAPPPLAVWPILTKAQIRADLEAFQSETVSITDMMPAKTSGSSGEPFEFRVHRAATDYSYACLWRSLRRYGLRPGDRRVYIWGRSFTFNATSAAIRRMRRREQLRNWFNNTFGINAYQLSHETVDAAIDQIEAFRPSYLHGYVSALYAIARRMTERSRTFRGFTLLAVVTESEKLYDFQREAMVAAFGCPILEHYGSVEFGNIAQPDPCGQLRVADDLFKLETQVTGELLVTNLMSHAFPMIRYRIGDMATLSEPPPGDPLPYGVLKEVIGRTVDLIPIRDGGYVHGVALAHVIDPHLKHVRKYQIHQTDLDRFVVRLVVEETLPSSMAEQIVRDLRRLVGDRATIDVTTVADIAPAPSGKFRWVLSDVSDVAERTLAEQRGH